MLNFALILEMDDKSGGVCGTWICDNESSDGVVGLRL